MTSAARVLLVALLVIAAAACSTRQSVVEPDEPEVPAELVLQPSSFARMAGWPFDDHAAALATFQISCGAIANRPADSHLGGLAAMGSTGAWHEVCRMASLTPAHDAHAFFETWFRPWQATNAGETHGLFTGYYEPLLQGSRSPSATYHYPLYRLPAALASMPDRAAIDNGALDGMGLELVWVDDPVAAFFLHIQGSGRVALDDGSEIRVGYAGQNGHAYFAIGRLLIDREEIAREDISLQTIRDWLHANPDQAFDVMETNPSYIFFHELDGPGPLGAQGVPLTPGRSLAVDKEFLAYGAPVWLSTHLPDGQPWNRLMIAQDTGGAINGPVRGDIFFGGGDWAEWMAGHMKGEGRTWILLPHLLSSDLVASLDP
ncbi:MAG: MltA domain-containing protein [Alphaproteobacteria bacterium]|nr:murein transglycosylase [Rhodospirillaceae bacterium]MBT6205970.1 murein transglycosylase [Rhodospirillaceae bacterium]MBT6511017.1 murein transglycosylase [Rhodospirillaceae bacterium]MBT7646979.1 murein transglycosylase [Rhodospirillaceae bacterium]MDG2480382.1 MltA domain-containing protein [Alphaproteobacteria bacterium]